MESRASRPASRLRVALAVVPLLHNDGFVAAVGRPLGQLHLAREQVQRTSDSR
jgi:hypothetical protein